MTYSVDNLVATASSDSSVWAGSGVCANAPARVATASNVLLMFCTCACASLAAAGTGSGEASAAVGVAGADREVVPRKRQGGRETEPCSATMLEYYLYSRTRSIPPRKLFCALFQTERTCSRDSLRTIRVGPPGGAPPQVFSKTLSARQLQVVRGAADKLSAA